MAKTRKRTPKERVLARYPLAVCLESRTSLAAKHYDSFTIYDVAKSRMNMMSDTCFTERDAWSDAASRLSAGRKGGRK